MSDLIIQSEVFENIKKLCANYNKDSASRKTTEYLAKRLLSLESQWEDFKQRNIELEKLEDKAINYFLEGVYEKTRLMYKDTRKNMLQLLSTVPSQSSPYAASASSTPRPQGRPAVPAPALPGAFSEKVKELLEQQEGNFSVIERVMAKINLAKIDVKWELEDYLSVLKSKWENIDKLHLQIEVRLKGANSEYNETYNRVETRYDNLKREINNKIWVNKQYQDSAPRIEITEFNGDPSKWIAFRDLFLELIHKNPAMSDAQKMKHLKTKLRGEAERIVQHLTISTDHYKTCWSILEQRYDNHRLIFTSFMNTMMNLPVTRANSVGIKKMHDVMVECVSGLQNIGVDTSTWDPIIVYLMSQKLDEATFSDYMRDLRDPRELPRLDEFTIFLENKFTTYDSVKSRLNEITPEGSYGGQKKFVPENKYGGFRGRSTFFTTHFNCPLCNGNHALMFCENFRVRSASRRNSLVAELKLCKNCLFSHRDKGCTSVKTCRECGGKHHTMLHVNNVPDNRPGSAKRGYRQNTPVALNNKSNHVANTDLEILLTTVMLKVKAVDGTYVTLRCLLDQGSQVNIITERAAQILRLPRRKMYATLHGVGDIAGNCKGRLNLECQSSASAYTISIEALIMKKMVNNLPNNTFKKASWPHLDSLQLADPDYNISRPIDLLLGADVYAEIIMSGLRKGECTSPTAQQTQLGWILCGKLKTSFNCHAAIINMKELAGFWDTEDILQESKEITTEDYCEKYFQKTTTRAKDGKYIVKMPMIQGYEVKLGNSRPTAVAQYLQLERKLAKNNKLAAMYKEFIAEYSELQHLKPAVPTKGPQYFLPHHGVLRENATTTKLRVVFNASQSCPDTRFSLNDVMEKGPNMQKDIQSLILGWRAYRYVYTADIEKFYRCILLAEDQQPLQKIIWRDASNKTLQELQLRTVTYGLKCASWLAMRSLKQLAIDDGVKCPEAAHVIMNQFYCDDLMSGSNSLEQAKRIQKALISILKCGGMNLRKWASNEPALLHHLPADMISTKGNVELKAEDNRKTLGLSWNPRSDSFRFDWEFEERPQRMTKRQLLSEISRLYDPAGWLSPTTLMAKLIFQKVWLNDLGWNDILPNDIQVEWQNLKAKLPILKDVTIPRWIGTTSEDIQLMGFCDASEKAYSCVVYAVTKDGNSATAVKLLAAKTRVVPTSQKVTMPRLELCGALLLSNLIEKIKNIFHDKNLAVAAWSDSQVVLAWLQGTTKREAYVTNRAEKIKKVIPPPQWNYIKTGSNPADLATRGLTPKKLINKKLWWEGPDILKTFDALKIAEGPKCLFTTNLEMIKQSYSATSQEQRINFIDTLMKKRSSLAHVQRVVAWVIRFITRIRSKASPGTTYLATAEVNKANEHIVKYVQQANFVDEFELLKQDKALSKKSKLNKLNPFVDEEDILRVGGRIANSLLPFNMKHPAILPHRHRLTELIIDQAHLRTLHGGARLSLAIIRQTYWIVGGNRAVKEQLSRCVRCHRYKSNKNHQMMADLPYYRVTPSRPFTHCGIDFTGYVDVKLNKGRGVKTCKEFIVIFICMVTKAVCIELTSDMSTQSFIAAFQRMCGRRGTPQHVYTDCGTNFVGAARVLKEEFESLKQVMPPDFFNELHKLEVQWHFNAPAWPSAGGLWESAVKSMKHHLRRVLGDQKLTYEEFTTLLVKIEACMNSRPLCPLTEDPDEFFNYLTPGHFLTGSATMLLPQPADNNLSTDLRKRWQLTERMWHQYWKGWSSEYLTQLQARSKWQNAQRSLKKDDIVLVKDDNLPPGKWAMGRVIKLHPGRDGHVRVVTLLTKTGVLKRPIVKLSPLPVQTEEGEQSQDL